MAGHGDRHCDAANVDFGVDFFQSLSCNWRFEIIRLLTVFKSEKALSHRVTKRNFATVNKSNLFCVAPSEKISCNLATKTASTKQKTRGLGQFLQVKLRRLSPLHKL